MIAPGAPRVSAALLAALCLACTPKSEASNTPEDEHGHEHPHGDEGHGHRAKDGGEGHGHHAEGGGHHRFENPEEWVEHFESPEREAWQKPDAVVAHLSLASDASVADLGAGTGYFAVRLAAAAPHGKVYAVDIEPGMVEWLGKRAEQEGLANLEAVQGESGDPKLPASVDLAFMCNVFHHLEDPKAYFETFASQLNDGGRVVIVDYRKVLPEGIHGPPEDMRMSYAQIEEQMLAAGYILIERELELLERQYLLVFERH